MYHENIEKQTDLFKLSVKLTDAKLIINLQNHTDWCTYEGQFTESNIGKEIHRKLELADVYSCFCQNSGGMQEQSNSQSQQQIKYQNGEIQMYNGNKLKYKISKQGKVTTFTQIIYQRNNKNIEQVLQSNLQLTRSKEMSEMQKLVVKNMRQKKQLSDKFQSKINQLTNQNIRICQKIVQLEQKNNQHQKIIIQIQQQLKQYKQQFKQYKQESKKQLQASKPSTSIALLIQSENYINKFKQTSNTVTYIGQDGTWTKFFIKQQIPYQKTYKFKIKIINYAKNDGIMIGVCDYGKEANSRSCYSKGNAIAYYGYGNGFLKPGGGNVVSGFKQGDMVQVKVSLSAKKVEFYVNGSLSGTSTDNIISDSSRKFYPYVQLWCTQDSVQWLGRTIE